MASSFETVNPPASASTSFATTSIEKCETNMQGICGKDLKLDSNGEKTAFSAHVFSALFGVVRVSHWAFSGLKMTRRENGCVQILFPCEGSFACRTDNGDFIWDGRPFARVNRPGVVSTTSVGKASGLSLCVPGVALIERAERLLGGAFDARLFDEAVDGIDLGGHLGAALAKTAQTAINEFSKLHETGLEGLILGGYEEMLLNLTTCAVFPHVAEDAGLAPQPSRPRISEIRAYIQAHSAEAMEMSLVASRFGLSLRAMQENFRRYYRCSPRDFLFDCRLDNAHRVLRSSNRALTVLDVAIRCGFSDYKHFSAKYRDRFLEPPTATLRAARR